MYMGKTRKAKTTAQKKTRKSSPNPHVSDPARKISIEVNWDASDGGLSDLKNERVFKFLTKNAAAGYNLIQTQKDTHFYAHGKTKMHLQAIKVNSWPVKLKWWGSDKKEKKVKTLDCYSYNDWIKKPPCGRGLKREKIFLKLKSNEYVGGFGTYLWRLFSDEIDGKKHKVFVKALKTTFKKKPIFIHNTDVDWFHAKEDTERS
jgi:hypothetical protein